MTCFKEKIAASYQIKEKEADAAPPTPAIKKGNYYHGTPTKENAVKIWKEGVKPDISKTEEHSIYRPISGHVYCTKNIAYALVFALAENNLWNGFIGYSRKIPIIDKAIKYTVEKYGQFGYIFVIPGSKFNDVSPDEDNVGQAIYDRKLPWLNTLANNVLKDEKATREETCVNSSLLKELKTKCYPCWIKAGKLLLPYLTDKQKLEIIKKYDHIAHEGILHPTEMWQFDRNLIPKLKRNGSNFFQLAKKITSI